VDFRLLGRLEVWDGSRPVALGGPKQKAVLAALLLRHGEVVSTDLLMDEVWGERASSGTAKTLQVYVWQLRRVLEPGRLPGSPPEVLVTQSPGYVLRIDAEQLDAERFERLAHSGHGALEGGEPDRALGLLDDGLALWRGAALADFAYEAFAEPAIARLEELRLAAVEDRIDAKLAIGGHLHAVAELEALVTRHPLRERLRRQLVLAMYQSDRQADALAACRDARRMLADELGIEPSRPLQELERAILNQDPALAPPPAPSAPRRSEVALGGTVGLPATVTASESGVLSFVIADIRGYTAFTQSHGDDAAAELAARFARIAREGAEAYGGEVVELRGDEALAVFPSPRQALRAAAELQMTFADECDRRPHLPLRVGIGVDAGEAVPMDGGYRGGPLNLAARLCAQAGAGEIIVSMSVFLLARPLEGISFEELGEAELKGMADPVPIFRAAQETSVEPPEGLAGRRSPAAPSDLPAGLAVQVPVIGRDREVRRLGWAWRRTRRGGTEVVLITGPAGIGKTRLLAEGALVAAEDGARLEHVDFGLPGAYLTAAVAEKPNDGVPLYIAADRLEQASIGDVDAIERVMARAEAWPALIAVAMDAERASADVVRAVHRLVDEHAVIRLGALGLDEMRRIGELYVGGQAERIPAPVLEATGGAPQRVHQAVADWAHAESVQRLDGYAAETVIGRDDLRKAEGGLADSIVDLQVVRERAHVYGGASSASTSPPYKGLARFDVGDGEWFFGRERVVAEMVSRMAGASLLGVVGSSGSGKSSAVRAGLVGTLNSGMLPRSDGRIIAIMRPGEHPLRALDRAIWAAAPEALREQVAAKEGLLGAVPGILDGDERIVLVVDQFEELFTICTDEEERTAFVDALVEAATRAGGGVTTVAAVRADFYGRCAAYPELARLLAANHVLVGPMNAEEYRQAIEQPALRTGTRVEPALVDALVSEVLGAPGALPLLSTTLLELWEQRTGSTITTGALEATGGVKGAVARLAEGAYGELDDDERALARGVFLRLAGPGEGRSVVKRRVPLAEFETEHSPEVAKLLDVLARRRLITLDESSVEITHEALLREWPRYQDWLDEDQQGRVVQAHLAVSAREWAERDRDAAELYRGARLSAASDWAAHHDAELNPTEREFLAAGRTQHQAQMRRLRGLLVGAVLLLVVAAVAGAIALSQRDSARRAATAEEAQRLGAQALLDKQVDQSLLLAREAVNLDDSAATRSDLFAALVRHPAAIGILQTPHGYGFDGIAVSPDGRTLAVGNDRGDLIFFNTRTRQRVGTFSLPRDPESAACSFNGDTAVAFQPHGSLVAVAAGGNSRIWFVDPATSHAVGSMSVPTPTAGVSRLAFSPDGRTLVAGFASLGSGCPQTFSYRVQRFSVTSHSPIGVPRRIDTTFYSVDGLRYTPDGRDVVASSYNDSRIVVLDATSWRVVRSYPTGPGGAAAIAISPDGRTLAIGYADGTLRFMSLNTGHLRTATASNSGGDFAVEFTLGGKTVVTTATDATPLVTDVRSGEAVETLTGHTGSVGREAVSPDGRTLYTSAADGKTIIWDLAGSRRFGRLLSYSPVAPGPAYGPYGAQSAALAISPDGHRLALTPTPTPGSTDSSPYRLHPATVELWDLQSLNAVGPRLRGFRMVIGHGNPGGPEDIAFSPNGQLLAAGGAAGASVAVWKVHTGRIVGRFPLPPHPRAHGGGLAFSPDGRTLASGDGDHATVLWDLATGKATQLRLGRGFYDYTFTLAYNRDGSRLATADYADRVILWDVRNRHRLRIIKGVNGPSSSSDPASSQPNALAFSSDGTMLATAGSDGVAFWDSGTGHTAAPPIHIVGGAHSIAFSPNGRTLAIDANDGVELWDLSTRQIIGAPLPGPADRLAFSPDGRTLVGTSFTGQAIIWNVTPAAWERQACQIAGRNLTRTEWAHFVGTKPYSRVCP